ncbi:hypothetical protein [Roseibium sp.]|uniref:hypothetical protein n=1 Tax=Roseibium sp. TaxID=1936156 RepID=UPI003BA9F5EB
MEHPLERRLAAIVAMDMVGFSRLVGLDEEGTIARQQRLNYRNRSLRTNRRDFMARTVLRTDSDFFAQAAGESRSSNPVRKSGDGMFRTGSEILLLPAVVYL